MNLLKMNNAVINSVKETDIELIANVDYKCKNCGKIDKKEMLIYINKSYPMVDYGSFQCSECGMINDLTIAEIEK